MPGVYLYSVVASKKNYGPAPAPPAGSAVAPVSIQTATEQPQVAQLSQASVRPYDEYRDGSGVLRVRQGLQTDGKYGIRIWNSAGVLQIDNTYT